MNIIYNLLIYIIIIIIFYMFNIICKKNNRFFDKYKNYNKYCCIYSYYEKDELYKNNFNFFLKEGILNNVDYYIIINGDSSVNIPDRDNIVVYKRENKGYDFGAYSYAINKLDKTYDYYFFINTSICGPYFEKDKEHKDWIYYFLDLFNEDVKVVGTSINICREKLREKYNLIEIYNRYPLSHVQSMFFCIDNEYFNYLNNINFFNEDELNNAIDMHYVIVHKEIGLSQHAINNNWNINCILSKYKNIDYRILNKDINNTSFNGDPYYKNKYFGEDIDKYEVIFYKNNR